MVIMKENSGDPWSPIDKSDFLSALKTFRTRKMSLFVVGPDHYLIEDANLSISGNGIFLFTDKNGLIVGFDTSCISKSPLDKAVFNGKTWFNFLIGREEYKLVIN